MKSNALDTADAEERQAVLVLQPAELALDGGAAAVEVAPAVGASRDERVKLGLALAERDDGGAAAFGTPGVDAVVVVAAVHRDGFGLVATLAYGIEQRRDVQRFVPAGRLHPPRKRQARRRVHG